MRNLLGTYMGSAPGELYKTKKGAWFEIIGRNMSGTQFNVISEKKAKSIIGHADPDLYLEMYDDV